MNPLESWLAEVGEALGVDPGSVDVSALLDLTRDVAHSVARPAGPLTTFLVGLAVGRHGLDRAEAIARVAELAARHSTDGPS